MIKEQRIKYALLDRRDIDLFLKWFNDPEITQYLGRYKPLKRDREEEWFNKIKHKEDIISFLIILIDQEDSKKIIGNCGIHSINCKNRACSCFIAIGEKEYQNKGYGMEAMVMLLEYGFNTLNMNRIELSVYDFNTRAYKKYKKVGFLDEGRKKQAIYHNGIYYDDIMMAILKEDWESKTRR